MQSTSTLYTLYIWQKLQFCRGRNGIHYCFCTIPQHRVVFGHVLCTWPKSLWVDTLPFLFRNDGLLSLFIQIKFPENMPFHFSMHGNIKYSIKIKSTFQTNIFINLQNSVQKIKQLAVLVFTEVYIELTKYHISNLITTY